ncbi:unnamed protein product [Withania somnifera]
MVLDERIRDSTLCRGPGRERSAKPGVRCSYGGSILERELKGPLKNSKGVMGNLSLYVAQILPSSTHYRWMLQPLLLWLQDGNEGRGGGKERTKLCDYAILGDGDHRR